VREAILAIATTSKSKSTVQSLGGVFCEKLVGVFGECFKSVGRCRSASAKRSRLWTAFNKASVNEVPQFWEDLYLKMGQGSLTHFSTKL
jgi:hypothetical protein